MIVVGTYNVLPRRNITVDFSGNRSAVFSFGSQCKPAMMDVHSQVGKGDCTWAHGKIKSALYPAEIGQRSCAAGYWLTQRVKEIRFSL